MVLPETAVAVPSGPLKSMRLRKLSLPMLPNEPSSVNCAPPLMSSIVSVASGEVVSPVVSWVKL